MTTLPTITLADFVLARFAEDEQVAREASGGTVVGERGNWQPAPGGDEWELAATDEWDEWLIALRPGLPRPPDVRCGYWGTVMTQEVIRRPDESRPTSQLAHAVRHDPARVLADCAVKRRIIALQGAEVCTAPGDPTHYAEQPSDRGDFDTPMGGCVVCGVSAGDPISPILRLLALLYADHPDYRQEWRP